MADLAYCQAMAASIENATSLGHSEIPGRTLGLRAENPGELIRQVERGFSFNALRSMESHSGISVARIAAIIGIPERTLARRKTEGRLSSDESERLLRISRIFENAVDLFEGDRTNALKWLTTPKKAFENQTPLEYSRTELGAREVENLMGRLEHGVFS
jgi:putative toxin-antitoxin system antitoxin component (TIGR02293 family)